MSSFDRRTLLMLPLALAACGFQPVYAPGGAGSALYGNVAVSAPKDVESYLLVQNLEQRLGRSAGSGGDYDLNVRVATVTRAAAITTSNETNRYSITGNANFTLKNAASGDVVAKGLVTDFVGYSASGSTVDTLADERDARGRLMEILADHIITRLYSTVGQPE